MNKKTTPKLVSVGRGVFVFSLLLGLIIFGIFYVTGSWNLWFVGLFYVIIACVVNVVVLAILLSSVFKNPSHKKPLLKVSGMILLNIPIACLCIWLSILILGYMRITFVNTTPHSLTKINIEGCQSKAIDNLSQKESRTVWVKIDGDCSIQISYVLDGRLEKENVVGYVTIGSGQKLKHLIGKGDGNML